MYLTYDEYKEYGGELESTAFGLYSYEAKMKIDALAHGRAYKPTEAIKRCIVRLTDILARADIKADKVTSWSNDGVSQSIKDVSAADYNAKINSIIRDYLANEVDAEGHPLLYLGVGQCD